MFVGFKRLITANSELNRVQDNVNLAIQPLTSNPLLNGILVTGIQLLAAKTVNVPYGLGRPFQGWFPVDSTASADIWRDSSANPPPGLLPLKCSADTTVSLWIF